MLHVARPLVRIHPPNNKPTNGKLATALPNALMPCPSSVGSNLDSLERGPGHADSSTNPALGNPTGSGLVASREAGKGERDRGERKKLLATRPFPPSTRLSRSCLAQDHPRGRRRSSLPCPRRCPGSALGGGCARVSVCVCVCVCVIMGRLENPKRSEEKKAGIISLAPPPLGVGINNPESPAGVDVIPPSILTFLTLRPHTYASSIVSLRL